MFNRIVIILVAIIAIAATTSFLVIRHKKAMTHTCINNLRAIDVSPEQIKRREEILALVPPGTLFSNMVAALGNDFKITGTNAEGESIVYFTNIKLPGWTNEDSEMFLLKSNVMSQPYYIKFNWENLVKSFQPRTNSGF